MTFIFPNQIGDDDPIWLSYSSEGWLNNQPVMIITHYYLLLLSMVIHINNYYLLLLWIWLLVDGYDYFSPILESIG
jgi:hypothetical protein